MTEVESKKIRGLGKIYVSATDKNTHQLGQYYKVSVILNKNFLKYLNWDIHVSPIYSLKNQGLDWRTYQVEWGNDIGYQWNKQFDWLTVENAHSWTVFRQYKFLN